MNLLDAEELRGGICLVGRVRDCLDHLFESTRYNDDNNMNSCDD